MNCKGYLKNYPCIIKPFFYFMARLLVGASIGNLYMVSPVDLKDQTLAYSADYKTLHQGSITGLALVKGKIVTSGAGKRAQFHINCI